MELVSALKEGDVFTSLTPHVVKMKQAESVFVVNVKGTFLSEPKEKIHASASASTSSRSSHFLALPSLHRRH